jgi:hypothetical protein
MPDGLPVAFSVVSLLCCINWQLQRLRRVASSSTVW